MVDTNLFLEEAKSLVPKICSVLNLPDDAVERSVIISHMDEEPVSESTMEDTHEELNESMEYTDDELDYAGNTPDYSDDYSCKKNATGMPKVVIYVLIGMLVLYVIIRILNTWKKPREDNQITKVNSSEVRMDYSHTGIAGMVMQRKHPFGNRVF